MERFYDRLWAQAWRDEYGSPVEKRQLKVLERKLKRRGLWQKNWWWGFCFNATDRVKFYKDVLAGVNHVVHFERYGPI